MSRQFGHQYALAARFYFKYFHQTVAEIKNLYFRNFCFNLEHVASRVP
jgi:hypothetical protein